MDTYYQFLILYFYIIITLSHFKINITYHLTIAAYNRPFPPSLLRNSNTSAGNLPRDTMELLDYGA